MAQGVAWVARELGLPATIAVPEHAPEAKLAAIERLGRPRAAGALRRLVAGDRHQPDRRAVEGLFVHPVQDPAVMAGNGTIGLEILEDLPDPDAVVIPVGGGGLTVGIASAVKALRPQTKIYTAEPATGAALHAALAAGAPVDVDYEASFVDGSGQPPGARHHVAAAARGGRRGVRGADRRRRGGGADAGRARAGDRRGRGRAGHGGGAGGRAGSGKVVCIVSGGNINLATLAEILGGGMSDA